MKNNRYFLLIASFFLIFFTSVTYRAELIHTLSLLSSYLNGKASLDDRLTLYGDTARERLKPFFQNSQIQYPPKELLLLALKAEKRLELYARNQESDFVFIRDYKILAASGVLGPKLREGDFQVPEGVYRISYLNPNSRYHLSLRINYPNDLDRKIAQKEGRTNLGGDIMIHGNRIAPRERRP